MEDWLKCQISSLVKYRQTNTERLLPLIWLFKYKVVRTNRCEQCIAKYLETRITYNYSRKIEHQYVCLISRNSNICCITLVEKCTYTVSGFNIYLYGVDYSDNSNGLQLTNADAVTIYSS